jgi:hypothetical protein
MALPGVKIIFDNGALEQIATLADGCLGFLALGAKEIDGDKSFKLGKDYTVKKLADLEALGVTAKNNPNLHRNVKEFYEQAGDGMELYLMGFAESVAFTSVLDKDNDTGAKALLKASRGKIRGLIAFKTPASDYKMTVKDAMDSDVSTAMTKAQALGEMAADTMYAPIFTLIEGYGFTGDASKLKDMNTASFNRVGIVIGDTTPNSKNACMGVVAGCVAALPVQRKISRVKNGALKTPEIYIGDRLVEMADVETINDYGYITFRTFVGKAGYFIADDHLATKPEDDYNSLSNRRVIDKAHRILYGVLREELNDEVPIAKDGNLTPAWCANVEAKVKKTIVSQMTAEGNLGNDTADPTDTGVECKIDYHQQILATKRWKIALSVKPNGYGKFIEANLGFKAA